MDMSSAWTYLPPLALAGAVFLLGMDMLGRELRPRAAESGAANRWAVITLLLVAAVAHVPVIPEHLREAPYMGLLFSGFALTTFGLAVSLAFRPSRLWFAVASALCAAAIGAYVATRLVAFPQLAEEVGRWTEPLGLVAISAEAAVVVLGAFVLRRMHR